MKPPQSNLILLAIQTYLDEVHGGIADDKLWTVLSKRIEEVLNG